MSVINAFNQHPSFTLASNSMPHGSHIASCAQQGGGENKISPYIMGEEHDELEMLGAGIAMQSGGGIDDAKYTEEQLSQMLGGIVQMGGKVKRNESISEAFFSLLKKRKTLASRRKGALVKGFKTLLKTRRKLFKDRKAKLGFKLSRVYNRSPAGRMVGRDMKQGSRDRIVLKQAMGRSMGRSIGRSMGRSAGVTGGGKRRKASHKALHKASHRRSNKKHVRFSLQNGGSTVGYSVAGVNLPSHLSALASPGPITHAPTCSGTPYQHFV